MSIFLEYMPGGSVRKLLDRFGEFEEKITRIYAAQMMRGLNFLHRNGVAHRDIKVRLLFNRRGVWASSGYGSVSLGGIWRPKFPRTTGIFSWFSLVQTCEKNISRMRWKSTDSEAPAQCSIV